MLIPVLIGYVFCGKSIINTTWPVLEHISFWMDFATKTLISRSHIRPSVHNSFSKFGI